MIIAQVIGDKQLVARLNAAFGNSHADLKRTIGSLTLELSKRVKVNKLSGHILNVRTGRLRRSIHNVIETTPTSIVGKVGTNVEYAAIHEFGGTVTVPQHLRLVKQAFGKQLKFPVWATVGQHSVTYPERSFLRSALKEMEPRIRAQIDGALRSSIKRSLKK